MPIEIPNVGRLDLAKLFAELDYKTGAEIGVDQAAFTEMLCKENPQAKIYGVDAWQCYPGYREHVDQEKMNRLYNVSKARLERFANCELIRAFSPYASTHFQNGELDFVYIDASHVFEHVVADLAAWIPKVRKGGIISGHDYRSVVNDFDLHVVEAVSGYTRAHKISPWFILGSKAVIAGETRERSRSWLWVVA
jgi:hypothetical protein